MRKYIIAVVCLLLVFGGIMFFNQVSNTPGKIELDAFVKASNEVVANLETNIDSSYNDDDLKKLVANQVEAFSDLGLEVDYISSSNNSISLDYYYASKIYVYTYSLLDTESRARREIYINEIKHYLMLLENSIK